MKGDFQARLRENVRVKIPRVTRLCAKQIKGYIYTVKESQTIIESLKKLKPELTKRYSVSSIGIFGSVVREDFSPAHSDVDIIVDFSKQIGVEFIDLAEYLESNINRKIDLVSKKGIKPKYFEQIQKEILYV